MKEERVLRPAPTYADLARAAGVSPATVDRVMNGRHGVRPHTRALVLTTWEQLQFGAKPAQAVNAARPCVDFLIPPGTTGFISALIEGIEYESASRDDITIRLHRTVLAEAVDYSTDPLDVPPDCSGIAVIASDHPVFRNAIAGLMRRGVHVVTIASDVLGVEKTGYVGIDNLSSGRLAGYLIRRMVHPVNPPAKIGAIRGHSILRGQYEREMGLRQLVHESPGLTLAALVETTPEASKEATRRILDEHPDVAAIYNMTAGNRGVIAAIAEAGLSGRVLFVGHDLTSFTQEALLRGRMDFVIDQNPRGMAREAVALLLRAIQGQEVTPRLMPIQIYCAENLIDLPN